MKYGKQPDMKMYFINHTKKKVGSFEPLFTERKPLNKTKDKIEITMVMDAADTKDKISYYFIEEEWIADIKKM